MLLFGIATSVELFQEKLSRETIRCLKGSVFDVQQPDVEDVFKAFQSEQTTLWTGPGLSRSMLQRQRDYIQSHSSLIHSFKVTATLALWCNSLLLSLTVRLHDALLRQSIERLSRYGYTNLFCSNRAFRSCAESAIFQKVCRRMQQCTDPDTAKEIHPDTHNS